MSEKLKDDGVIKVFFWELLYVVEKDLEARQMLPHSATMGCRGGGGWEGGWVVVQSCCPPLAMSSARQVGMGAGGVTST